MLHIPIIRAGVPYRSLNTSTLTDFRTGEPLAELSLANPGLIARDSLDAEARQKVLRDIPMPELLRRCQGAAEIFARDTLPLGDGMQSRDEYIQSVSATTGMPLIMVERNMAKIQTALAKMDEVLDGLTRGLDLGKIHMDFRRETASIGAILPNNSPGVHSLWPPAIALQIPLVIKPGSREPWSPYRIIQAMIKAGIPAEAFCYYPTDVNGTREVLMRCGKAMFFGDKKTVEAWKGEDRIQLHGPGWSKVLLGPDMACDWKDHVDLMAESIAKNGGRSCINASGVWTTAHGRELAEGLGEKLAKIKGTRMDDPDANLCAFTDARMAKALNNMIDRELASGGAVDMTAKYRDGDRLVEVDGATFLLPTVIYCESPDHPLASAEYLLPFATVVECDAAEMADRIGPTLVATVLSKDEELVSSLLNATHIDRINVGPIPTNQIRWDQPHEGNLFEFLYKQRAVQYAEYV